MATASSAGEDTLTEDLNCPICLDLLTEPVTLYFCFHSFCKECLENSIQGAREAYRNPYNCPQCRRRFYPSDVTKVNHHLNNIVNSHRKSLQKIANVKQIEMQDMTSKSRDVKLDVDSDSKPPSKKELDSLTSFLTAVDGRLQSLLTALDNTSIKAVGADNEAYVEESAEHQSREESSQSDQTTVVANVPVEVAQIAPTPVQRQQSGCEFEAETLKEFVDKSLFIFRRHFILILFVIHLCLLVFCFVMAFL